MTTPTTPMLSPAREGKAAALAVAGVRARWLAPAAMVLVAAAVALVMYQPWQQQPIDIADYGKYAPLLQKSRSVGDGFSAVTRYYVKEHGRTNVVVYALLAIKWWWLGDSGSSWMWARGAAMLTLTCTAYALLRRLGCDRLGSAAGASLFLFAGTASQSWFKLNVGEPFGVLLALGAMLLAAGYARAARWGARAAAIVLLCTAALLTKEMLALLLPVVVVIACCHVRGGRFAMPRLDRRSVTLVVMLLLATLAVAASVLLASRLSPHTSYVSPYSMANASWYKFVRLTCAVLFPIWPTDPADVPVALVGNLLFAGALWAAARGAFYRPEQRGEAVWHIVVATLPILVGVLLYLPWPSFAGFYGLPMLVGPALLTGWALSTTGRPRVLRRAVAAAFGVTVLLASVIAHREARQYLAGVRLQARLAAVLSRDAGGRPLVYLTREVRPASWDTRGANLSRFAAAHGLRLDPGREAACDAPARRDAAGVVVVSFSTDCGPLPAPVRTFRETYRFVDLRSMSARVGVVEATVRGL